MQAHIFPSLNHPRWWWGCSLCSWQSPRYSHCWASTLLLVLSLSSSLRPDQRHLWAQKGLKDMIQLNLPLQGIVPSQPLSWQLSNLTKTGLCQLNPTLASIPYQSNCRLCPNSPSHKHCPGLLTSWNWGGSNETPSMQDIVTHRCLCNFAQWLHRCHGGR